jgi:hypothetical protein
MPGSGAGFSGHFDAADAVIVEGRDLAAWLLLETAIVLLIVAELALSLLRL